MGVYIYIYRERERQVVGIRLFKRMLCSGPFGLLVFVIFGMMFVVAMQICCFGDARSLLLGFLLNNKKYILRRRTKF